MNITNKKSIPRVSVIMGVYNHEQYLAESIYSVLNQTYKDFELIIINDASPDNSKEIIKEIIKINPGRIIFIDNKINSQRSDKWCTEQGLEVARGEFIAWQDDDDIWYPTKLEKQMQIFEQDDQKKIGLVYSYGRNINENPNRMRSEVEAIDLENDVFKQMFKSAFFFKHSMVVRKSIYDKLGRHNIKYIYCPDYEYMLRIAAEGFGFDRVPEILVAHRIHYSNDTSNRAVAQENTKEMLIEISTKYKHLIRAKKIDVKKRLSICDLQIARYYFVKGENKLCREYILKILKFSPSLLFSERALLPITFLSLIPKLIRNIFKHIKPFNKLFLAS